MRCLACQNEKGNRIIRVREMMFGMGDSFDYLECSACASLGIVQIPKDLANYYGGSYYSFRRQSEGGVKRFLKQKRAHHALGRRQVLGALLCWFTGLPHFVEWIRTSGVNQHDAILDVGCGAGRLLRELRLAGFDNLTGIDPFLPCDVEFEGIRLRKGCIEELDGTFDFIMLHHSFEHIRDPNAALCEVHRLLRPGRSALVRCPVAGSYAHRAYGANWVQIDAPRHLFIPSRTGFEQLAKARGFELLKTTCDSTKFQFEGSELYRRGLPLRSRRESAFRHRELREFARLAARLNRDLDGDSACFYLRKPGSD
jgi:SAM-dependent methyltransferase